MTIQSIAENLKKKSCNADVLWHFTSIAAFHPILEKGLWATHASDLTDGTECLARNVLLSSLVDFANAKLKKGPKLPSDDVLKRVRESIKKGAVFPVYVASFSSNPDFEYMWQAFTPMGGVAIGFSGDVLRSLSNREQYTLLDCDYDLYGTANSQAEIMSSATTKLCNCLTRKFPEKTCKKVTRRFSSHLNANARYLAFLKRKVFVRERETRLIRVPTKSYPVNELTRNGKRGCYVPLGADPSLAVKQVIISPKGDTSIYLALACSIADHFNIPSDRIQPFSETEYAKNISRL